MATKQLQWARKVIMNTDTNHTTDNNLSIPIFLTALYKLQRASTAILNTGIEKGNNTRQHYTVDSCIPNSHMNYKGLLWQF